MLFSKKKYSSGFSLIELLVGIAVLTIIATSLYRGYANALQVVRVARLKTLSVTLANEQFEIIRNLPYSDVGLINGIPAGKIQRFQNLVRDGVTFNATTTIRNAEDPFDGLATGTVPIDTAPNDYKQVAIEIGCSLCIPKFQPLEFTVTIAPKDLETATNEGSLFVKVFDSAGAAIPDAVVTITNASNSPQTNILDNTNVNGMYQLVGVPPGSINYSINVTKNGYSTDRTYAINSFGSSTPINPHKTVATTQVTQASFAIDRVSTLNIASVNTTCVPTASVPYTIAGAKLIASAPSVVKYSQSRNTGATGVDLITGLEWDTYTILSTDSTRYVSGTIPLLPISVSPNSSGTVTFIMAAKNLSALLVTVKDANTLLPLSGVSVRLTKSGFDDSRTTGQGYWRQADWSGGSGQSTWAGESMYASSDGNLDTTTAGSLKLQTLFGSYVNDGYLISSTFDTGTTSSFYNLTWQPQSQPPATGATPVRFQIASNNDNSTWNYTGPDGTTATYYTSSNQTVSSDHNGHRYVRYKVFLHTDDSAVTPTLSEFALTFSSQCAPPGQVFLDNLSSGTYTVDVTKSGYQNNTTTVSVPTNGYASTSVMMSP